MPRFKVIVADFVADDPYRFVPSLGDQDLYLARCSKTGTLKWLKQFGTDKYDEPARTEQDIIDECRERFRLAMAAESDNRKAALEDIRFANGDQWPTDIFRDRESDRRPCLTINITDAMVRRVTNALRDRTDLTRARKDTENAAIAHGTPPKPFSTMSWR